MIHFIITQAIILLIIFFIMLWFYNKKITDQHLELLSVLVNAKDQYTAAHQDHVTVISCMIYDHLPKSIQRTVSRKKLIRAAKLHDLGKLYVSDTILNKVEKLTDEEFGEIKLHASIGAKILDRTIHKDIAPIVAMHHERIDGHGYVGAKDSQIPIESKIIALADTFSSITTDRIYRTKRTIPEAFDIIEDAAGTQLDEVLVKYFLCIDVKKLVMVDTMLKNQYYIV